MQVRPATVVNQPPGDAMASRCCRDMAYQRAVRQDSGANL